VLAARVGGGLLIPLQAALNRTELRLPTTVSATIELKPKQERGIAITFDRGFLSAKLPVASLSHMIDQHFIIVVAQVNGAAAAVPARPKNIRFQDFRTGFERRLDATGATWMRQGQLSAYVDRALIQQLASQVLGAGPLCMNGKMNDLPVPFNTRLRLPPVDKIDCTPTRDCRDKRDCAQRQECAQRNDCNRCLVSAFGRCQVRGNDPTCEAGKVLRKGQCEAQKVALKAKCEADKEATNKLCELKKVTDKGVCETYKETYKRWRAAGPNFGNIESRDFLLSGTARACLNNVSLDDKDLRLRGKLTVQAKAHVDGHIKFTPLNVTGHTFCLAPYEKGIAADAEVPSQPVDVDTLAQFTDGVAKTAIQANFSNKIRIEFPFRSILMKFGSDPAFAITCPILETGILLRLATPDDWWPQAARGNLERDLPGLNVELDLVQKPVRAGDFVISGKLRRGPKGIGGTFTLSKKVTS
jgi:hypothetical protein